MKKITRDSKAKDLYEKRLKTCTSKERQGINKKIKVLNRLGKNPELDKVDLILGDSLYTWGP